VRGGVTGCDRNVLKGWEVGADIAVSPWRAVSLRAAFALCVVTAVVAMGVIRMWPAGASNPPTRPIDRDVNNYALFALDTLSLGGGNAQVTHIDNGDVGVQSDNASDQMNLCSGGGNHDIVMGDGTQANSNNLITGPACSLWDVYSNNMHGSPVIRNSGPNPFTTPIIPPANLPPFPAFSCNPAVPVNVPNGASQALPPGTYGAVTVRQNATLTLSAGTYTFCDFNMGPGGSLVDVNGTIVKVEQSFSTNGGSVGPSNHAHFYVRGDSHTASNDRAVSFGRFGEIHGIFWVPFANLSLGHGTDLTGNFWGLNISSDFNVQVHGGKQPCVDP
jgi:hypothetical protein